MPIEIPFGLNEVNADWLTAVLTNSGWLENGRVVYVDVTKVGEGAGFMGHVAILNLTLDPPADAPLSLVLKIPTETDNRHLGQAVGVYEREIRFYQELAPGLQIRSPGHIYSAMDNASDPAKTVRALELLDRMPLWLIRRVLPLMSWLGGRSTSRYVLLLENLQAYRIGDQVGGCSLSEARQALDAMSRMHAQYWDGKGLESFPWLLSLSLAFKPFHMMYLQSVEQFKSAHGSWLTQKQMAVLDWLKVHYVELTRELVGFPETLIHGDFRLDNLCFDDSRGEVVLFDWQTLGRGPCGFDLAYFLSASFAEPLSTEQTNELITYYGERLAHWGVAMSFSELRWQYEAGLLAVLHRVVPAQFQDMLDLGEGRGIDLIDSWLERGFRELERVDLDRVLVGPAVG